MLFVSIQYKLLQPQYHAAFIGPAVCGVAALAGELRATSRTYEYLLRVHAVILSEIGFAVVQI